MGLTVEQRRKNGRDKPYAVKYWGLGNEIDGPWQLGHKNAEVLFAVYARYIPNRTRRDGSAFAARMGGHAGGEGSQGVVCQYGADLILWHYFGGRRGSFLGMKSR